MRLGFPPLSSAVGSQRTMLATELQRAHRGHALLDEPTEALHPADIAQVLSQLHRLLDAGNTVVLVEQALDTIVSVVGTSGPRGGYGDVAGGCSGWRALLCRSRRRGYCCASRGVESPAAGEGVG